MGNTVGRQARLAGPGEYIPLEMVVGTPSGLASKRSGGAQCPRLRASAARIRATDTRSLVASLEIMEDPLLLWIAQLELDARGLAPAVRWPPNFNTEQMHFMTWIADLLWLCRRLDVLRPRYKGWKPLLKHPAGTKAWQTAALHQYIYVAPRYSISHWCSKGLQLSDEQRLPLMTLPTNRMKAERRVLEPERFREVRELALSDALRRPDKARKARPEDVANRRAAMWRTYVLCGRDAAAAARQWGTLSGSALSRQAFSKHVDMVEELLRRHRRGLDC